MTLLDDDPAEPVSRVFVAGTPAASASHMRTILFLLLLGGVAHAEPHRLSLEVDPIPYVSDGYDGVVAYQHPALPRFRVSLSAYVLDLPAFLAEDGRTDGRMRGNVLKLAYHSRNGGRGWMLGAFASITSTKYGMDDAKTEFPIGPIAGYRWFPFERGLFLYPWGRLDVTTLKPFVTVHLGYEFSL
jgi:hypothetical protein